MAKRSYDLLVNQYGIHPEDIIFDPLVFPVGTGDEQYIGSAVETIEGIRMIKETMPECQTILGISNVSFGLPDGGPRSAEFRLPVSLHEGRARLCDRQYGEAGALCFDSGSRSGSLRKT